MSFNMLTDEVKQKIDVWVAKYPKEQKQSAVMEALRLAQVDNNNTLSDSLIKEIATHLEMPIIKVAEVASFYENYDFNTPKKHQIRICHNISCMLSGGDDLINYLKHKLEVKNGEVSKYSKIQLKKVECLGACVGAPMMQIGDTYYENLTTEKLDKILESL